MTTSDLIVTIAYDICVEILIEIARFTGFTYKEVNVILFCIILPLVFVFMGMIILYQWYRIYKLSKNI